MRAGLPGVPQWRQCATSHTARAWSLSARLAAQREAVDTTGILRRPRHAWSAPALPRVAQRARTEPLARRRTLKHQKPSASLAPMPHPQPPDRPIGVRVPSKHSIRRLRRARLPAASCSGAAARPGASLAARPASGSLPGASRAAPHAALAALSTRARDLRTHFVSGGHPGCHLCATAAWRAALRRRARAPKPHPGSDLGGPAAAACAAFRHAACRSFRVTPS